MFVHSSRIRKHFEYLQDKGIHPDKLSRLTGIPSEETLNPEKRFTLDQLIAVLEFALDYTGDSFYGLKFGSDPHIGGTVGMFCASCRNLKEAFIQGCKYLRVHGEYMEIEFIEDSAFPKIRYSLASAWTLKSPATARQEVEAMFSFLVTILKVNSNHALLPRQINLTGSRPQEINEYEKHFGIIPYFDQEENEIIFRERDLLIPMKAFNPETFEVLRMHIETQLKRSSGELRVSEKVKTILLSSLRYSFPDIDTVASRLSMSPRTLQRHLSQEKTSYKALLRDIRFDLASQLLSQKNLTISEISYMLGYSDLGNFSRSFKRYAGVSPQQYRQQD